MKRIIIRFLLFTAFLAIFLNVMLISYHAGWRDGNNAPKDVWVSVTNTRAFQPLEAVGTAKKKIREMKPSLMSEWYAPWFVMIKMDADDSDFWTVYFPQVKRCFLVSKKNGECHPIAPPEEISMDDAGNAWFSVNTTGFLSDTLSETEAWGVAKRELLKNGYSISDRYVYLTFSSPTEHEFSLGYQSGKSISVNKWSGEAAIKTCSRSY